MFFIDGCRRLSPLLLLQDGTWRVFNIDVWWQKQEACKLVSSGKYETAGLACIALAPDHRTVAVGTEVSTSNEEESKKKEKKKKARRRL